MSAPERRSPLADRLVPGRFGKAGGAPVRIAERSVGIVQLAARRGRQDALAATLRDRLTVPLPLPGRSSLNGTFAALWLQPNAWLILGSQDSDGAIARTIGAGASGLGSIVDQTHGRAVITLSGAAGTTVLSRICRIDLHPRSFPAGQVAATPIAGLPCLLHRPTDEPAFEIVVFATFAAAFLHRLTEAAAGVGYEII